MSSNNTLFIILLVPHSITCLLSLGKDRVARTGTGRSGSGGRTSSHRYSSSDHTTPPGLMALGNAGMLQGINYKNDPASCTVFVSNVSIPI